MFDKLIKRFENVNCQYHKNENFLCKVMEKWDWIVNLTDYLWGWNQLARSALVLIEKKEELNFVGDTTI